jgi:hypothetical protein
MPALGFDPAPGDVGLTQGLARRHSEIAQELQQVLALVRQLDLSSWQGETGNAVRALQGTFPPALQNTVSAVQKLQAAASSWAGQLSGFQAEADALERKAASASGDLQALQNKQAALPPGSSSSSLKAGLESASTALARVESQAQDLHQRYLAASRKTAGSVDEHSGLWGKTEPVRTVLEAVLAPLDIVAADHWVEALKEIAGVPKDWVKEVDNQIGDIGDLVRAGKSPTQAIIDAGYFVESTGTKLDAWYGFAPGWLRAAAGSLAEIKGLSYTLTGLGIVADAGTMISPQDKGALGWADRGVAAVNGSLLVINAATDWVPGAGEVVIAATGAYLAGDYLYHHWTPFRDVANDIGHAVVSGVEGDVATAKEAGHLARSAWHSVTSTIGSWF